jgi:G3E family GTPase
VRPSMSKPITVVTGVHADATSSTVLSLAWDLPRTAVVRHHIDLERCVLERMVSDVTGIVEHVLIDLEHACVPCAIREDVVPTLERLAGDPRWGAVIAHLPVAAEAEQLCRVLAGSASLSRALRVHSVIAAVDGARVHDDLLGDELLCEREMATSHEDRRGVGEVCADIVEFADEIVVTEPADPVGVGLVRALARPDATLVTGTEQLDAALVTGSLHDIDRTRSWTSALRAAELPPLESDRVWRVDLRSDRAFHPGRFLSGLEQLGTGRHRSRGCFWLPTRADRAQVWSGAGGQVSIGNGDLWGGVPRQTRIVITGVGTAPGHLEEAFDSMLLQPGEEHALPRGEDGFEPWLGPIRVVA